MEQLQQDYQKLLRVFDSKSLVRIVETRGDPRKDISLNTWSEA